MPNETVYVCGAGLNRVLHDRFGNSPPLANEFLKQFLSRPNFQGAVYRRRLHLLLEFIGKYWHLTTDQLAREDFDIEEFFTFLRRQFGRAYAADDTRAFRALQSIDIEAKRLIFELLGSYEHFIDASPEMRLLGELICRSQSDVITLNYDTLLEQSIRSASPFAHASLSPQTGYHDRWVANALTDHDVKGRFKEWHQPLSYYLRFDEVQLIGVPGDFVSVPGKRLYSFPENEPYSWSVLKLHGSLNWFRYLPISNRPPSPYEPQIAFPDEKKDAIVLSEEFWSWASVPERDGWLLDPIVVPPTLYKDEIFGQSLYRRVFEPLWSRAREVLGAARHLVVIGYSFPSTDFHVRELFLTSFADRQLETLSVVNPSKPCRDKAKRLCPATNVSEFSTLTEFFS
jgi:hypothetical protein